MQGSATDARPGMMDVSTMIALGCRYGLSSVNEGGAETWAILSMLINTAEMNGIEPETWLTEVLERVVSGRTTNDRLGELLAWNRKGELAQIRTAA